MYRVQVEIRNSNIDGKGVFALESIPKGTIVWQYTEGHDKKISREEFDILNESTKTAVQRVAYLSPTTKMWVLPPGDDPACYTNHDPTDFNTSVSFEPEISEEPLFRANRDIAAGDEITNNYTDFDENSTPDKFKWL
ncbi:MAG TPA: SET domain-containing protein [Candidatus Saccharimonadales bacterium]|nr:SET domain-containing protein [Candidatus Saccharimonadales bacterium]